MKAFSISGQFQMGGKWQPFTIETVAKDKAAATDWTFAVLGSRHRVKRRQIKIKDVHSEKADEVQDAALQYALKHEDEYLKRKAEGGHV